MEITEVISGWDKKISAEGENKHSISELCRLCGNENNNFLPLFGSNIDNGLRKKIEMHLPIHPRENDGLPQRVCYFCASTVLSFSDIYESILKVEENFLKILKNELPSKQGAFVSRNKGTECGLHSIENRKPLVSIKPVVRVVSVKGEIERLSLRSEYIRKPLELCLSDWNERKEGAEEPERESVVLYSAEVGQECVRVDDELDCSKEELNAVAEAPAHHCEQCGKGFKGKSELVIHLRTHTSGVAGSERLSVFVESGDDDEEEEEEEKEEAAAAAPPPRKSAKPTGKSSKRACGEGEQGKRAGAAAGAGARVYACEHCGRPFSSKTSCVRHARIHTGERPFTCDVCGKQFRAGGGLRRHLRDVHARVKSFACDLCGRCFASKATRDDHRRIHTGERPFVCHRCGNTFKSKASLYIHAKIHSDSFPHACTHCHKRFRRRQELVNHVTTHTGEKPHACDKCGKAFGVRGEMLRHRLTHSDERPFLCALCNLAFKQKRYLRNHEKTHRKKASPAPG